MNPDDDEQHADLRRLRAGADPVPSPVIGVGMLAATISLFTGIAVFAAVTGCASLALAAWHLGQRTGNRNTQVV